ncbi:MAG: tetratricopeptide repeat protein [Thermodesulfovibrionales bacterium]|nr:tetratricopeptide repeat protein [Thermodesulfovibrionales bacterium]
MLSSCALPKIAVIKDPLTPEEHINLGVSYEQKRELEQALDHYQSASKRLPVAHLYMGNIYFQKEDYKRAEESYKKAIKKTDDPRAYNNLAWLYFKTGRELEKARALAEKAVELSPESGEFKDTLEKIREAF